MVARTIRFLVVLVLVMGVAGPVAAGEEMAAEAGAGVTALEAGDAVGVSGAGGVGVGEEVGVNVAAKRTWQAPAVAISEHVVMVSAGGSHSCALLSDGTARCWGDGFGGRGGGWHV